MIKIMTGMVMMLLRLLMMLLISMGRRITTHTAFGLKVNGAESSGDERFGDFMEDATWSS